MPPPPLWRPPCIFASIDDYIDEQRTAYHDCLIFMHHQSTVLQVCLPVRPATWFLPSGGGLSFGGGGSGPDRPGGGAGAWLERIPKLQLHLRHWAIPSQTWCVLQAAALNWHISRSKKTQCPKGQSKPWLWQFFSALVIPQETPTEQREVWLLLEVK